MERQIERLEAQPELRWTSARALPHVLRICAGPIGDFRAVARWQRTTSREWPDP